MSPKTTSNGKAAKDSTTKNGKQTPDEHLEKANKAMSKAWSLISQRKSSTTDA